MSLIYSQQEAENVENNSGVALKYYIYYVIFYKITTVTAVIAIH